MNKPKLNEPDVEQTTTIWGTTQSVSYSNYPLKNYKINFEKLKEQEEQKIFKEFEELGYKITKYQDKLYLKNKRKYIEIIIYLNIKIYDVTKLGKPFYQSVDMKLHQLLHKLFEIWGWFDE